MTLLLEKHFSVYFSPLDLMLKPSAPRRNSCNLNIKKLDSCLILDIHLGGMSGISLQKHLSETGDRIPVIFITAFDDEMTHRQMLSAGVPFLIKPFPDQKLIDALEGVVGENG